MSTHAKTRGFGISLAAIGVAVAVTVAIACAADGATAPDARAGKAVFEQCTACHSTDGNNGVGPSLQGVVRRKAGIVPGFRYSRAMKSATLSWDEKTLDGYIADPQTVVPGNLMPFSGLPDAKQRADLIAYLATLK
jgi:cytochrome c